MILQVVAEEMNENLLELIGDEIEVVSDDNDQMDLDSLLSSLRTAQYEVRNNRDLSSEGQRGALFAFSDFGHVTWVDGTAHERIWLRTAMQEAVKLGLSRDRIQVALENG
jgi:hypothetical protein